MTPSTLTSRTALLAVLLAGTIALGACGRRGRPEPPPNPDAPRTEQSRAADKKSAKAQPTFQGRPGTVAQNDDDDDEDDDQPQAEQAAGVTPVMPSTRKKRQPFVVPKDPFILDPIL